MNEVAVLLAIGAGSIVGKLYDPLAWCLIGVLLLLAIQRFAWWHALLAIFAFTAANIAIAYSWWIEQGLGFQQGRAWRIFFALLVIGSVSYGVGRLVTAVLARRRTRSAL